MSEKLTTLNTSVKQIINIMMQSTNRIIAAINRVGSVLAKTGIIGKGLAQSTFGKESGLTKMPDFNKFIDQIFGGKTTFKEGKKEEKGGLFSGLTKDAKGVSKLFKGVGKTLGKKVGGAFAKLGPQMLLFSLIMEPLQALIGAFLEPLDALIPIFEAWGSILSQLLIPIIQVLMEILIPLTPAFVAIVEALMPLIDILAASVGWLVPMVEIIASLIVFVARFVGMFTNLIGFLQPGLEMITQIGNSIAAFFVGLFDGVSTFFIGVSNFFATLWNDITNGVKNFGAGFVNFFNDLWADLVQAGKDFLTGGFDGDPDTWW